MENRSETNYGNVIVVQRSDFKWGVIDLEGKEIVPFGKYNWIDGFDSGLARVKSQPFTQENENSFNKTNTNFKWGIINEKGEEVLPIEYSSIWKFYGKNRYSTKVIKDGEERQIYFHDLNPDLPIRGFHETRYTLNDDYVNEDSNYLDYEEHSEVYAGSYAQFFGGCSDEVIDAAFEGDPENYWNID